MPTAKEPTMTRPKSANGEISVNIRRLKSEFQQAFDEMFRRIAAEDGQAAVGPEMRKSGKPAKPSAEAGVEIKIWEDDPDLEAVAGAEPEPAEAVSADLPSDTPQGLKMHIVGNEPEPEIYDPATPQFRYWNAASALARGINYWGPLLPAGTVWSADNHVLQVQMDEGADFNAYYARESGLNFFHGVVTKVHPHVTVYSGESPDVLCHELGHAILDAVKPELFNAMSMEVAAFHEGFGDISATLSALQIDSFREFVLNQTGGQLNINSRLSQMARQLGWAIRMQYGPSAVDSDCLRNTCNNFFYRDPSGLPPDGPATQLTSEPHNFSRVFSGAFLDVLAGMFQIGPAGAAGSDSDKLQAISVDAGKLIIEGVRLASVGSGYYSQVAAGMIQADQTLYGGRYRTALSSSFVQRGILSPAAAVALVQDLKAHGGQVFGITGLAAVGTRHIQFEGDNEGYRKSAKDTPALPLRPLITRFGVTLHVHMPSEPNRFGVASAAVTGGAEKTASAEEDARSYVEDLIQLDRICHEGAAGVLPAELTSPGKAAPCARTHQLVRDDGKTVLKRHHFDCGYCGRRHGR
jgi:hypothetical protein